MHIIVKSADSTNANLSAKLDQKCLEIVELEKQSVAAKAQIMQEQDKLIILTERLHKTELKVETMERLHQSYRSRVSEYDQCCVELGVIRLLDKLNQPSQDEYQFQVDGMLLNAIKNITRDIEGM